MSAPLNTYGLTPLKLWKFWDIDGWQLLVSIGENADDDSRDSVTFSVGCEQLGAEISVSLSGPPLQMAQAFAEAATDEESARRALQAVLDQAAATFPSLIKKAAHS